MAERSNRCLQLALRLLGKRRLEGAEIEIRRASEEVARVLLLEKNVLEIMPPKIYLPHLKKEATSFYRTFSEIHNLERIQRNEVETAIYNISKWLKKTFQEI